MIHPPLPKIKNLSVLFETKLFGLRYTMGFSIYWKINDHPPSNIINIKNDIQANSIALKKRSQQLI